MLATASCWTGLAAWWGCGGGSLLPCYSAQHFVDVLGTCTRSFITWFGSQVQSAKGALFFNLEKKSTSMCQEAELLSIRLRMVCSSCNKPVASDCTDVYRSARLGRERGSASSGGQCCSRKFPDPAVLPSTSNLVTLGQFPSLKVTPASRTVSQGIMQILGSTKLEQDCAHPCRF